MNIKSKQSVGVLHHLEFRVQMHLQQSSWVTERHIMNYANHYGYSDVTPYEVVKVISDKTIEVREMDAERDDSVQQEGSMSH